MDLNPFLTIRRRTGSRTKVLFGILFLCFLALITQSSGQSSVEIKTGGKGNFNSKSVKRVRSGSSTVVHLKRALKPVTATSSNANSTTESSTNKSGNRFKFYKQKLDHFNSSESRHWPQRFLEYAGYQKEGGPVFFYIDGEGSGLVDPLDFVNSNGSFVQYAQEQGAYIVALEHRYFGKSHPTEDLSTDNLKFLAIRQAIEDIASFSKWFRVHRKLESNKWVLFGSSYGGSLATWFTQKYPNMTDILVASSAPLELKYDMPEFLEHVGDVINKTSSKCYDDIAEGLDCLDATISGSSCREYDHTIAELKNIFNLCGNVIPEDQHDISGLFFAVFNTLSNIVVNNVPDPKLNVSIEGLCKTWPEPSNEAQSPLISLGEIVKRISAESDEACLEFRRDKTIKYLQNEDWTASGSLNGDRQFQWQRCNELGWVKGSGQSNYNSTTPSALFGSYINTELHSEICRTVFGLSEDIMRRQIEASNVILKGKNIETQCGIYVNGQSDPWSRLGISTEVEAGNCNRAINIRGASHAKDNGPIQHDISTILSIPPDLRPAQKEIGRIIGTWLKTGRCCEPKASPRGQILAERIFYSIPSRNSTVRILWSKSPSPVQDNRNASAIAASNNSVDIDVDDTRKVEVEANQLQRVDLDKIDIQSGVEFTELEAFIKKHEGEFFSANSTGPRRYRVKIRRNNDKAEAVSADTFSKFGIKIRMAKKEKDRGKSSSESDAETDLSSPWTHWPKFGSKELNDGDRKPLKIRGFTTVKPVAEDFKEEIDVQNANRKLPMEKVQKKSQTLSKKTSRKVKAKGYQQLDTNYTVTKENEEDRGLKSLIILKPDGQNSYIPSSPSNFSTLFNTIEVRETDARNKGEVDKDKDKGLATIARVPRNKYQFGRRIQPVVRPVKVNLIPIRELTQDGDANSGNEAEEALRDNNGGSSSSNDGQNSIKPKGIHSIMKKENAQLDKSVLDGIKNLQLNKPQRRIFRIRRIRKGQGDIKKVDQTKLQSHEDGPLFLKNDHQEIVPINRNPKNNQDSNTVNEEQANYNATVPVKLQSTRFRNNLQINIFRDTLPLPKDPLQQKLLDDLRAHTQAVKRPESVPVLSTKFQESFPSPRTALHQKLLDDLRSLDIGVGSNETAKQVRNKNANTNDKNDHDLYENLNDKGSSRNLRQGKVSRGLYDGDTVLSDKRVRNSKERIKFFIVQSDNLPSNLVKLSAVRDDSGENDSEDNNNNSPSLPKDNDKPRIRLKPLAFISSDDNIDDEDEDGEMGNSSPRTKDLKQFQPNQEIKNQSVELGTPVIQKQSLGNEEESKGNSGSSDESSSDDEVSGTDETEDSPSRSDEDEDLGKSIESSESETGEDSSLNESDEEGKVLKTDGIRPSGNENVEERDPKNALGNESISAEKPGTPDRKIDISKDAKEEELEIVFNPIEFGFGEGRLDPALSSKNATDSDPVPVEDDQELSLKFNNESEDDDDAEVNPEQPTRIAVRPKPRTTLSIETTEDPGNESSDKNTIPFPPRRTNPFLQVKNTEPDSNRIVKIVFRVPESETTPQQEAESNEEKIPVQVVRTKTQSLGPGPSSPSTVEDNQTETATPFDTDSNNGNPSLFRVKPINAPNPTTEPIKLPPRRTKPPESKDKLFSTEDFPETKAVIGINLDSIVRVKPTDNSADLRNPEEPKPVELSAVDNRDSKGFLKWRGEDSVQRGLAAVTFIHSAGEVKSSNEEGNRPSSRPAIPKHSHSKTKDDDNLPLTAADVAWVKYGIRSDGDGAQKDKL